MAYFEDEPGPMMLDHIDRHCSDPDLSAETLARKFHCSERYVHKLFSGTGRSFGEHVNHPSSLVDPPNRNIGHRYRATSSDPVSVST